MAEPLLDIKTLTERPVITIDGTRFEILSLDELSIVDTQRFQAWGKRLSDLIAQPNLDDAEAIELVSALHQLTDRIMVGVPDDVKYRLSDASRIAVAEVFMKRPGLAKLARKGKKRNQSTGAKSRRGSNGSTAATPSAG